MGTSLSTKKDKRLEHENSMLRTAVRFGDLASVQMSLRNGCDPDAQDQAGSTALHVAALVGNVGIIRIIVSYKGSVNLKNKVKRVTASALQLWHFEPLAQPRNSAHMLSSKTLTLKMNPARMGEHLSIVLPTQDTNKPLWPLSRVVLM